MKRNQNLIQTGSAALAAGLLAILATTVPAHADDPKPEAKKEEKKKKWDSTATLGVTLTRGNSKNFLATGSIATKRTWKSDEALLGASAGYGQNTTTIAGTKVDTTTDSYVKGFGQWNHLFSPVVYGGVRLTGEHDDVAALTYRTTVSPLAGYYFIKETNTFLVGEIGPSYVREKFFGETVHNYIALRLGERGEHKFASGAKVWESLEWFPKIQDFNNYLVNAEAGVAAPISKALSVSLVVQDTYKNVPAKGKLKNDLKLIAGLAYNF
jgi:putative salt-induced outer membrane protein YdiY